MKKIYTYALAALMAAGSVLGVSAQTLDASMLTHGTLSAAPAVEKTKPAELKRNSRLSSAIALDKAEITKTPARAAAKQTGTEEWEYIGDATYTDGILYAAYGDNGLQGGTYKVPAYQSKTNENRYMLEDVYPEESFIYELYMMIDETKKSRLILDKSEGDDKVVAEYTFNCTDGDVLTVNQQSYGKFNDLKISFAAESFGVLYNGKLYAYSLPITILLPGAKDYSIALSYDGNFCNEGNKALFTVALGADATNVKYGAFKGTYRASAGNLAVVAQNGQAFNAPSGSYSFTLSTPGWNTIFFVSVDASGNVLGGDAIWFYVQNHDADQWYHLGNASYNDDTFLALYGVEDAVDPYDVEVLESKATPGLFRVVDMMKGHPYYVAFAQQHDDHSHYVDIDATAADAVTIAMQPIGAGMRDTDWGLGSITNGTFANGKITFDARGLAVYANTLQGYYANQSGNFALEVPNRVTLTVKDEEGNAVAGAAVTVGDKDYTTDEAGQLTFGISSQATEPVNVGIYKDGFEYAELPVSADKANHVIAASATLEVATCTINVIVNDEEGEPIAGATVTIADNEYITDENGRTAAQVKGVLGTKVPVTVYKDGYEYYEGEADLTESNETTLIATLEASTCTVNVIVNDEEGEPIEGALVTIGETEYTSDANGKVTATLKGAFGTKIPVTVYKDGYEYYEGEADLTETLDAYVIATLEASTCTINVIVNDEEGEPIEGATVTIGETEYTSDANGKVTATLKGAFGTKVPVTVYKDGYEYYEGEADLTETLDAYVIATLEQVSCNVTVLVRDAEEEPVEGATVTIGTATFTSDANGKVTATLKGAFGTKVAVKVTKQGYQDFTGEADFTESIDAYVIAVLKSTQSGIGEIEAAAAKGEAFDLNGRPVAHPATGVYIINGKKVYLQK